MYPSSTASGASPIDGPYAWLRLTISLILGTIGGAGMWAVIVVLPSVQAEFGIDRAGASLSYAATLVGVAVGNVIVGRAIDTVGYWRPALISCLALGSGFILASLAHSNMQFVLAYGFLIGIGTAANFGPLIADISHWFQRRRGVAVAVAAAGNYIAGTIWPALMPWAIEAEGWRFTYAGIGVICLAAMIPLILLLRRPAPHEAFSVEGNARPMLASSLSPRVLQVMLVIAGLSCCVAMSMPQVHLVAYCMDLGYGMARGSEMLALMMAAGIVSRIGSGFIADWIGGVRTVLLGSILQCLALLLYIPFDGLASLYVVSLVFGLSQGGIVPSYAVVIREYLPAKEAGQRVGIVITATILGMALGGWMSGWIYDLTGSYAAAFLNGIGWNLLNIFVMLTILSQSRRQAQVAA